MVIEKERYPYSINTSMYGHSVRREMWDWCNISFGNYKNNDKWTWSNHICTSGEFKFSELQYAEWFVLRWSHEMV